MAKFEDRFEEQSQKTNKESRKSSVFVRFPNLDIFEGHRSFLKGLFKGNIGKYKKISVF